MLTPQKTSRTPNAVYMPQLIVGMDLENGRPVGRIHACILQQAEVDAEGLWHRCGDHGSLNNVRFGFDEKGAVVGLPDDLQKDIAADVADLWEKLTVLAGKINAVRKLA